MSHSIQCSINEPIRSGLSWSQLWKSDDQGLIVSWEVGRELAIKDQGLCAKAVSGELPVLDWKGGVEKKLKLPVKYGSLLYYAQWQGLRGEDLDIDLDKDYRLVCSRTGMVVVLTADRTKYVMDET